MRTVFCACGHRLIAVDDARLFQQYRTHVDATHPDHLITNEQIRAIIAASAHDYEKEPAQEATTYSFHARDRVVTNKFLLGIPAGTGGTVVKVYAADCYDVHLDGFAAPCFMFSRNLMLAPLTN